MPEWAEIRGYSELVNAAAADHIFRSITKSEVHKCAPVVSPFPRFRITSVSRGKEMKLTLMDANDKSRKFFLLFRMGMVTRCVCVGGHL